MVILEIDPPYIVTLTEFRRIQNGCQQAPSHHAPSRMSEMTCPLDIEQLMLMTWPSDQGLTLVHFPAQRKRFLWDRGAFRDCSGGVYEVSGGIKKYQGVLRLYFLSETAQVELKSGRV